MAGGAAMKRRQPDTAKPNGHRDLARENTLLRREVERLQARLDLARLKEIKLLSDIIALRKGDRP